jgi:KDO2-lipid IV(A) lauroyltransferase
MIFYLVYRFGYFLANNLPLNVSYRIASFIADVWRKASPKDKNAVVENLRIVFGKEAEGRKLDALSDEVFRNFGKYLVEFFRLPKVDRDYIARYVKIEGLENVDKALSGGKGVITLSAHIGNWELGGFILSLMRQPMAAVVLTHKNRRINEFFNRQRILGNVKPIEFGLALRGCYEILKKNGILALLGDRDFSTNGVYAEFFGRKAIIPPGPAALSQRLGSAIVPSFMIREEDDTFRLIFEDPIFPDPDKTEEEEMERLAARYISSIEDKIRKYPSQWYVFKNMWNDSEKNLCPNPIV